MNNLTIYYSLSGVVEKIAHQIDGDHLLIKANRKIPRSKFMKMFILGSYNARNKDFPISYESVSFDDYDQVTIVYPIWAGDVSAPIKAFLKQNTFKNKQVKLIASCAGKDSKSQLTMEQLIDPSNTIINYQLYINGELKQNVEYKK